MKLDKNQSQNQNQTTNFYNFTGGTPDNFYKFLDLGEDSDTVELKIEGAIVASKSWFDELVEDFSGKITTGAKQFIETLGSYSNKKTIRVLINSPGGDVFAATSIYNHLRRTGQNIEVEITGYACSAATIIMMAGDKISMPKNALVMIHDPLIQLYGAYNLSELEKNVEILDKVKQIIINSYKAKVNLDDNTLSKFMSKETWLDADECLKYGFIDEILHHKTVPIVENNNTLFINSISYDKIQINNLFKQNVKNYKNFLQTMEVKKEEIVNNEKEELTMDERQEILAQERERIRNLNKYINKIDQELITEAIENGWDEGQLTIQAFTQDKILTTPTIFDKHLQGNEESGVNGVKVDINNNDNNTATGDSLQDMLNSCNTILNIREVQR